MERAAVSRQVTRGQPPARSVARVRENMAIWYFSQISPRNGSLRRRRSMRYAPDGVFLHRITNRMSKATADPIIQKYFWAIVPIFNMKTVMAGRWVFNWSHRSPNLG